MLIIIRSTDPGGWETERELELPEDPKLVQALLRTVKRFTDPPKPKQPVPAVAVESEPNPEPELATPKPVRLTYKGFILAKCSGCDQLYGFNAKYPVSTARCKNCKMETPLEDMVEAIFHCRNCKKTWTYQTNSQDGSVDTLCIQCGDNLTAWWDKKYRRYETK